MRLLKLHILLLCTALSSIPLYSNPDEATETAAESSFSTTDALVLGLVEGVTEYLPVSSTGHLILTNRLLGLDEGGEEMETAANAYAIVIQGGAILAVLIIYWRKVLDVILGFLGKKQSGLLLGRNLIAAFLPAAVLGLLLDSWIEARLFGPVPVIIALAVGAFFMLATEAWRKKQGMDASAKDLHELSIKDALMIGFLQCIAMWPGTSRSIGRPGSCWLASLKVVVRIDGWADSC